MLCADAHDDSPERRGESQPARSTPPATDADRRAARHHQLGGKRTEALGTRRNGPRAEGLPSRAAVLTDDRSMGRFMSAARKSLNFFGASPFVKMSDTLW